MSADLLLGIDTAGIRAAVALGRPDGTLVAERRWSAGYRHGEELLTRIDELLRSEGAALGSVAGVIVGTGPGAFTGLRVGLATAKALAHGLGVPIVGIATSAALLAAVEADAGAAVSAGATRGSGATRGAKSPAAAALALLLPAGPSDRVLVLDGSATLVRGGEEPVVPDGTRLVAVDLPGRASAEALALGDAAEAGLPGALLRLGAEKLATGGDDVARLVPEYVTLPRGVATVGGEVKWSRDRR
jgi:tRNA threonylcarbamoyl adenosine modification protein YeaZ